MAARINNLDPTYTVSMAPNILLVGWGYPPKIDGGLDIHVKHLFEQLQRKDIDVDLALPRERAPERENIIPVETGDGDMVEKSRKMSQRIAEISRDYDIIHTHDWFGAESGFKSKKYGDVKWVSTFHSLTVNRNRNPDERLKRMEKATAESSDALISVSKGLGNSISEEYGIEPEIIHNGFSTPSYNGIDVKDRHSIKGDMIFYVGRHAEQKGLEHLIYGFKKVLDDKNDVTLVIGGKGHTTSALKRFVRILDIEEDVIFTGFIPREELGDYYRAADVFVSPSINEPFGLTITEALESGTYVVATQNGVEEIIEDVIISVEPESNSIESGIIEALEKDTFSAPESRSWEEMTEETLELYRNVIQEP